jgi:hypothetical protein
MKVTYTGKQGWVLMHTFTVPLRYIHFREQPLASFALLRRRFVAVIPSEHCATQLVIDVFIAANTAYILQPNCGCNRRLQLLLHADQIRGFKNESG